MATPDGDDLLDMYADGELGGELHDRAVDDLESDPDSQAYASGVRRLRDSLAAHWAREPLPEGLEARVRAALDAESPNAEAVGASTTPWRRGYPVLAAAASVVVLISAWMLWPSPPPTETHLVAIAPNRLSIATNAHRKVASAFAADAKNARDHLLLQANLDDARRVHSGDLGLPVQAPNLAGAGFEFLGSREYVIEKVPVAQLVYRDKKSNELLSLFTAPRMEHLRTRNLGRVRQVYFAEPDGMTTLAWNANGATYFACGAFPRARLLPMLGMAKAAVKTARLQVDVEATLEIVTSRPWLYDSAEIRASETTRPRHSQAERTDIQPSRRVSTGQWIVLLRRAIVIG